MNKLTLLIAALTCQGAAFAQIHRMERPDTSAVVRTYELNPIVVTGSGHHQRLAATTTPVRSLSAKEMSEQGITTLDAALTRMVPSLSMAPSSMGSFLRMNGLSGKYILVLINGQKLTGDISNNLELARVDLSRVKRIEVLDGAASSLYGSDAIAGVINIITDQPTSQLVGVTSNTRIADHGVLTESVNLDVYTHGFGSYTTYSHDRADSYRNNPLEYDKGSDTDTHETIAPLFTGYRTNTLSQRFTYSPTGTGHSANRYTINANIDYFNKTTDRPDTRTDITGGTDYEMAYRGLRWGAGGIYKFSSRNSLQADFTSDYFRYGREYDVGTSSNKPGDFVRSKRQHSNEVQLKAILGLTAKSTTVAGADWRRDRLTASSGNIDESAYIMAAYAQHEMNLLSQFTASVGARLDYHETFHAHLTPKAALMYSPGNFRLRATYSQGFRAPGLDEIFYHYYAVSRGKPQIIFGNHDLKPERSHYWSLSAEYRNDVVAATVTGYINRISDMVVRQDIPTDASNMAMLRSEFPEMTDAEAAKLERYSLYSNSDRGDVKGVQASFSVTPMADLNFTVNYAYTYARTETAGQWTTLERSIRNVVTLAANYHHAWGRYALGVNLNGRLQSKTYYNGTYENAPGYGLWNINTTHTFDHLKAFVIEPSIGIDNIFDRVDRRIDSSARKFALYTPGRMLVMGLKVRFKQ
mgnify:CR=1 FL=1